jgi:hypothetical protein
MGRMAGEHGQLSMGQADQARTDFAIIETRLEAIHSRRARHHGGAMYRRYLERLLWSRGAVRSHVDFIMNGIRRW